MLDHLKQKIGVQWRLSMWQRYLFYYLNFANYTEIIRYERFQTPFLYISTRDGLLINFNDVKTSYIVLNEIWKNHVYTKYYKKHSPSCVVDIGANVGFFSLFAARKWRSCKIFAYEPAGDNFNALQRNTQGKYKSRISPINFAVSNINGSALLNLKSACGCHSFFEDVGTETLIEKITVSTTSIESVISKTGFIDFLKIDCEGCEWLILKGKELLMSKNVGYIAMEYHEVDGYEVKDLVVALKTNGFSVRTDSGNMLYAENLKINSHQEYLRRN